MNPGAAKVFEDLVWQDPDRMSGQPCLFGTRIPISDVFKWLEEGGTLKSFVETYPHVPLERVIRLLKQAESDIVKHFEAA